MGFCETQTQDFMPKYSEENVKYSNAQRLTLGQIFALAETSTFSILFGLPCPGDLLKYHLTSDSGFAYEKSIVSGRICYSIHCPHALFGHGNNVTRT